MPAPRLQRIARWLLPLLVVVGAVLGLVRHYVLPGLSSARTNPSAIEVVTATWLLRHAVPEAARERRNPLGADAADLEAGRDVFRAKCEVCHGYDGGGRTEIGAGEYPHPPPLRDLAPALSD